LKVLGYVRVSTDEQRSSGAGLAAQRAAILAEAERRGWQLVEVLEDAGYSGRDLKRPAVQIAMEMLASRDAEGLVVAKLDRLSRSIGVPPVSRTLECLGRKTRARRFKCRDRGRRIPRSFAVRLLSLFV
jgi:DNA invertase Pin-like site-specific DNA recombinase